VLAYLLMFVSAGINSWPPALELDAAHLMLLSTDASLPEYVTMWLRECAEAIYLQAQDLAADSTPFTPRDILTPPMRALDDPLSTKLLAMARAGRAPSFSA
jgi:hypothetical protein